MINKNLKHAFNIIFLNNPLTDLPQKTIYQLTELLHETYIFQIKKGKTIITQGQPADYIYILLSGEGVVLNDIEWNINNTIDEVNAIDCLGITEYLT
jgi:cyclic nucleotide-binding domain